MRYYVVSPVSYSTKRYIVAETVREHTDRGAYRDTSFASALAGELAQILTEDEINSTAEGRALLEAWNRHDDQTFDDETRFYSDDPVREPSLVPGPDPSMIPFEGSRP